MTLKIEGSKPVMILLAVIAVLLFLNLIRPYLSFGQLYAEFNGDSFETDTRNLEKIANSSSSIARSLEDISNELYEIRSEIER
ncbi:hypothetical protein JXA84_06585 [candidate division WOR-3 bacterium]|nr:hypothetical protein [candidate division WOR-3 bacterium]